MSRIDLEVPFHEKEQAKSLGARWDGDKKVWYVPNGVDAAPLHQWLRTNEAPQPNLRAGSYFIAETFHGCWQCKRETRLYAFILPAGYEALETEDESKGAEWWAYPQPTLLSYVSVMPDDVKTTLGSFAPHYWRDYSKTICGSYWMNHCEHCKAKQGDFDAVEKPGAPFQPGSVEQARQLFLREIEQPFLGRASYRDYDPSTDFFEGQLRAFTQPARPSMAIDGSQEHSPRHILRRLARASGGLLSKLRSLLRI